MELSLVLGESFVESVKALTLLLLGSCSANSGGLLMADDMWMFRNTLGSLRRIDYISYNPGIFCDAAGTTWELDLGLDYRTVKILFFFMPGHKRIVKRDGVRCG